MKVKCPHCGKHFDYELHTGLCPHCSTYHSNNNHATDTRNTTYNHEPITAKHSNNKTDSTNVSKTRKHSRSYYVVTTILIILIIGCIPLTILCTNISNQNNYEKSTVKELIEPTAIKLNDTISYNVENEVYYLQITDTTLDMDEGYELPDGYEVVKVSYKISNNENMQSDPNDTYSYVPFEIKNGLVPYLVTKSGNYLEPISWLNIEEVKKQSYDDIESLGISDGFENPEGSIYFLVKENDTAGLLINYYPIDSTTNKSSEQLDKAYIITFSEVK